MAYHNGRFTQYTAIALISQGTSNGGNTIRFIPEIISDGGFGLEGHPQPTDSNFLYSEPMEYVEHPVAFVPTPTTFIENNSQGSTIPENTPLDVTMLAMMGLTLAGAGMMKTQTAQKKQAEQAQANAVAQAQLTIAQAEQKQSAQENWVDNLLMQVSANRKVYTKVEQSQANKDFWASYTAWQIAVAKAEEKRRQTELEAQIQAYYAALRLKPISPTRPTAPGLTNSRNRDNSNQGQKGNRNTRNNNSRSSSQTSAGSNVTARNNTGSSTTISSGSVGSVGSGVGGSWGGGHGLTISSSWDNLKVNQSQEDEENTPACAVSDTVEFFAVFSSILDGAFPGPSTVARKMFSFLITLFPTLPAVTVDAQCGGESATLNSLLNVSLGLGAFAYDTWWISASGTPIAPAVLAFILIKELVMGLGPGKTADENLMDTKVILDYCPPDGVETVGDNMIAFIGRKFYLGDINFPLFWDAGRFVVANPLDKILESNHFPALVEERFLDVVATFLPTHGSSISEVIPGLLIAFEGNFSEFITQENINLGLQPYQYIQIGDRVFNYPLIAEAALIHHLHTTNQLSESIINGIATRLEQLGVENPIDEFINPVINGEISEYGICQ